MSDVYLKAWHGGLGDALQFSTLPEEFSKQQDRKTYIVADAPFRNEGIYDLVWDKILMFLVKSLVNGMQGTYQVFLIEKMVFLKRMALKI